MANPQIENGHTDIANELIDFLCGYRISGEEMQVLWVILRKTWGLHKKSDKVSLTQFYQLTRIDRSNILRAINKLIDKNIIVKKDNGIHPEYRINKDYLSWKVLSKKTITTRINSISVVKNENENIVKYNRDNCFSSTESVVNIDNAVVKNDNGSLSILTTPIVKNDNEKLSKMTTTIVNIDNFSVCNSNKNNTLRPPKETTKANTKETITKEREKKEKNPSSPFFSQFKLFTLDELINILEKRLDWQISQGWEYTFQKAFNHFPNTQIFEQAIMNMIIESKDGFRRTGNHITRIVKMLADDNITIYTRKGFMDMLNNKSNANKQNNHRKDYIPKNETVEEEAERLGMSIQTARMYREAEEEIKDRELHPEKYPEPPHVVVPYISPVDEEAEIEWTVEELAELSN